MEENEQELNKEKVVVTEPMTPQSEKEKKKNKVGMIVGIVCLVVLAVAGLSFGAYAMITKDAAVADAENKCEKETCENSTVVEVIESGEETKVTFTKANSDQEEVKNILSKVYDTLMNSSLRARFYRTYGDGTIIKVSDTTYTWSNESYGVESEYDSWSTTGQRGELLEVMYNAYKYAEDVLVANGFKEGQEFMWSKAYYNDATNSTCNVNEENLPFVLECSKNSWIPTEAKELAVMFAKTADASFASLANGYEIKNSEVAPYQTTIVSGLNYAMLFYRVSPDAKWEYFTGTQGVLDCNDYTGDAAKAFAGDTCWDTEANQESTVQP